MQVNERISGHAPKFAKPAEHRKASRRKTPPSPATRARHAGDIVHAEFEVN